MQDAPTTPPTHAKVPYGHCGVCGRYGDDCAGRPVNCVTCGSEIVETVNDSLFRDGECGGCEYARYRSQPALLDALDWLPALTLVADLNEGFAPSQAEQHARRKALAAIAKTRGTEPEMTPSS